MKLRPVKKSSVAETLINPFYVVRFPRNFHRSSLIIWGTSCVNFVYIQRQKRDLLTFPRRTNIYKKNSGILAPAKMPPKTPRGLARRTAGLKSWNFLWDLFKYSTIGIIRHFWSFWLENTKILNFKIFGPGSIYLAGTVEICCRDAANLLKSCCWGADDLLYGCCTTDE